jgi:O-acetylserine/cysteine efflux transporter
LPLSAAQPNPFAFTETGAVAVSARELIILLAMCVIWGFHYVVIKVAIAEIPPIFYAAMRMTIVAACLAPFLRWRPGKMKFVLLAALCFGAFNYVFLFTGVSLASASASAIANQLYVPFAAILSVVFLKEKIGWRRMTGISLAFAGVAIIVSGRDAAPEGVRIGVGVGLVAIATLIEAMGSILVKKTSGFKPWELLAWFGLAGTLCLWPITFLIERNQFEALAASDMKIVVAAILYSALLASVLGHTTYYWLLQRRPVSEVASSSLLTTFLAVSFSILMLGEPLTATIMIGGVMTLIGVGVVVLRAPATAPEPGAPEAVVIKAEERP